MTIINLTPELVSEKVAFIEGLVNLDLALKPNASKETKEHLEANFKEILNMVLTSDTVIDDHDNMEEYLQGFVVLRDGHVCPIYMNSVFCLNDLYVDDRDGKLHISQSSVAGNISTRNTTLKLAVEKYNKEYEDNMIRIYKGKHNLHSSVVYILAK